MGIKSSFLIAWRSLSRRKTKNLSVILAVTLGVTLLVGIAITTDTLENAFLTSLLQSEGEVDLRIINGTGGGYLKATDYESISDLVPEAVGIMPELITQIPVLVASQFNPRLEAAGIPANYSGTFGNFYDWKTGEKEATVNLKIETSTSNINGTTVIYTGKKKMEIGVLDYRKKKNLQIEN